jgi:hypothetical protein
MTPMQRRRYWEICNAGFVVKAENAEVPVFCVDGFDPSAHTPQSFAH